MFNPNTIAQSGRMLVSQPMLVDTFFSRSVVMLAEHGEEGSFGFILNKPANVKLSSVTKDFLPFDTDIFIGGPVNVNQLFYVHNQPQIRNSLFIKEGIYWGGDLEQIKSALLMGELDLSDLRFYAGYSSWESKQLDDELNRKSWVVIDGKKDFIFGENNEDMWKKVVMQLGGKYAKWINYPVDPALN